MATYENPPLNYYTDAAVGELGELVGTWNDASVRVVVLAGPGSGPFITHFDPDEILSGVRDPERIISDGPVRNRAVNRVLGGLGELSVPVIAAMNGDTMGFGLELALACDLRIGQHGDDIRYGFPEVRLGIIPGSGGSQRLARICGLNVALDMVLRARVVTPEEALRIGIVNEIASDALGRAIGISREIESLPQLAVGVAKRELREGVDASFSAALAIESDASVRAKLGPDAGAVLTAYTNLPGERRREWLEGGIGEWSH